MRGRGEEGTEADISTLWTREHQRPRFHQSLPHCYLPLNSRAFFSQPKPLGVQLCACSPSPPPPNKGSEELREATAHTWAAAREALGKTSAHVGFHFCALIFDI